MGDHQSNSATAKTRIMVPKGPCNVVFKIENVSSGRFDSDHFSINEGLICIPFSFDTSASY